jgi:predicted nucleic acid-binding Zn ribbon protein
MATTVPPHGHCMICAKPIPVGETLCSEKCKERYNAMLRRRRLMLYLMYGMLAALIAFVIVSGTGNLP